MSIIQFASGAKRSGICATSALAALLASATKPKTDNDGHAHEFG